MNVKTWFEQFWVEKEIKYSLCLGFKSHVLGQRAKKPESTSIDIIPLMVLHGFPPQVQGITETQPTWRERWHYSIQWTVRWWTWWFHFPRYPRETYGIQIRHWFRYRKLPSFHKMWQSYICFFSDLITARVKWTFLLPIIKFHIF